MTVYESTVLIAAPTERIWPVLSAVQQWPEWTPTVSRVEVVDSESLIVGARFKVFQPKLRPAFWAVTQLDPAAGFTWESKQPGIRIVADHILNSAPNAQTAVTLRITFLGLLGKLVGRLSRTLTQSYLAQECAGLKQRVEREVKR